MLSIFSLLGGTLIERARETIAGIEAETSFIAGIDVQIFFCHHSVSIDYANPPDGYFPILFHIVRCLVVAFGELAVDEFVPCVGFDFDTVDFGGFDAENVPVVGAFGQDEPAAFGAFGPAVAARHYSDGFFALY